MLGRLGATVRLLRPSAGVSSRLLSLTAPRVGTIAATPASAPRKTLLARMSSEAGRSAQAQPRAARAALCPRFSRRMVRAAPPAVEKHYATPLKWMHWVYGAGFATCLGTVLASQQTTGPTALGTKGQTKGTLMMVHKSTAVVLSILVVPRLLLRATSALPQPLPGSFVEHALANLSHAAMYAAMLVMPATGMAMGYYGGAPRPRGRAPARPGSCPPG
jgi:hypothetical protein